MRIIREQVEMFIIITFDLNNKVMAVQECILFSYFYDVTLRNIIVQYRSTKCTFVKLNLIFTISSTCTCFELKG